MEFWTAEELKEEFKVLASFYQMKVNRNMFNCRNHALIIRKGYETQKQPDAVIVMANPGSCSPLDSSYQPPVIQDDFRDVPYVSVKTDPTQNQLMRLMKRKDWNVISIINLSDVCSGNMADFSEKLSVANKYSCNHHSIFSEERAAEREAILQGAHSKVILAWGKDNSICELASNALEKFTNEYQIFGLRFQNPKWGFRHPNPMLKSKCIVWLEDMVQQLDILDYQSGIAATID
jgi:hypothetical protein